MQSEQEDYTATVNVLEECKRFHKLNRKWSRTGPEGFKEQIQRYEDLQKNQGKASWTHEFALY